MKDLSKKFIELEFDGTGEFQEELLSFKNYIEKNSDFSLFQIYSCSKIFGRESLALYFKGKPKFVQVVKSGPRKSKIKFRIIDEEKYKIAKIIREFYKNHE